MTWILGPRAAGPLLAHLPAGFTRDGSDELIARPDLDQSVADVDIDVLAAAVFADADLLPGNADDPVRGDLAGDPVLTGSALLERGQV